MTVQATIFRNPYFVLGNELVVRILGRDTNGSRVDRKILGTVPYFYVLEEDAKKVQSAPGVVALRPGPVTMGGRKTVRVDVRFPFDVPKVKPLVPIHFEADIVFSNRTRIDYGLVHVELPDGEMGSKLSISQVKPLSVAPPVVPRVLHIDIETNDVGGFGEPDNPTQPVLSVAFFDSHRRAFGIIYNGQPVNVDDVRKRIQEVYPKFDLPIRLFPVDSEHSVLGGFGELLGKMEPDFVTAWNGLAYDFPYVSGRAQRLLPADPGSADLNRVFESFDVDRPDDKYHGVQSLHGRYALLDLLVCYRKLKAKQGSFSLEAVAQEVLGFGKVKRPESVTEMWRTDLVGFVAYNIVDVLLEVLIDEKKLLVSFFRKVAERASVGVEDVPFNSRVVDGAILTVARESGAAEFALVSKEFASNHREIGEGAEVFSPTVGLFAMAVAFDLSQCYPGIIRTLNISPETRGVIETVEAYHLRYDGHNGGIYRKEPAGLVPRAVARIQSLRFDAKARVKRAVPGSDEYKEADMDSFSLKTIVNSFFGVLGSPKWRLSNIEMFNDVTGTARELLRWNRARIEDPEWLRKVTGEMLIGHVILGDTDSVYAWFEWDGEPRTPLRDLEQALPIAEKIRDALNASYVDFFRQFGADRHYAEVDIEGVYHRLRTLPLSGSDEKGAKKVYFGLLDWSNGKDVRNEPFEARVVYKGIQVRRYNNSVETKEVQKRIVELTLTYHPLEEIAAYVESERQATLRGERDEKLPIPTKLSKDVELYGRSTRKRKDEETGEERRESVEVAKPPFVRAMVNYASLTGRVVAKGDDFRWMYVRGPVSFRGKTDDTFHEFAVPLRMTLEEAKAAGFSFTLDRERMVEKAIDGPAALVCPGLEGATPTMESVW